MRSSALLTDADLLHMRPPKIDPPPQRPAPPGGFRKGVEITTRNLIYHVAPFHSSNIWRLNVAQLTRRLDLFNGRRVVAIATGPELDPPELVEEALGGEPGIEFLRINNCRRMRENATFMPLMERVESTAPGEATFYAHAKGVCAIGDPRGIAWWRNGMYHKLLDEWAAIAALLADAPIVGTHRMEFGGTMPDNCWSPWHFAGTFFWFRNADVFCSADWREQIPKSGWGAEAWPGLMFPFEASRCVWMENCRNPYSQREYTLRIDDDEPMAGESSAVKVELGGGETPRGEGFVNVDRLACADVQVDFELRDLRLPFEDASVSYIYSAHCLEHVLNLRGLLREIVRIGWVGALVEIRVPHWAGQMANCHGHVQTISPQQIEHWCESAIPYWFTGCERRLRHWHTSYVRGPAFDWWRSILPPKAADEEIMARCPDAAHEVRYFFHVIDR